MKTSAALILWLGFLPLAAESPPVSSESKARSADRAETRGVDKKTVVVKLDGEIREMPPGIDLGVSGLKTNLFWDQLRMIRRIQNDPSVQGLVLLFNEPELSLAQCQQMAMELAPLSAAGKKIHVHTDSISSNLYLAMLPADVITMTPGAELGLRGLSATVVYYKDLMDKLGVGAEVIHQGQYKLLAEPYTATRPSRFMDEQIDDLLDSLYAQIVDSISRHRRLPVEQVRALIDRGPFLAEQARDAGLIDRVASRSQALTRVETQIGGPLVYDYGASKAPTLSSGLSGWLQIFSMVGSKGAPSGQNKVAVVYVTGMIMEGESEQWFGSAETTGSQTMRRAFAAIRKDETIKAVVVRIDSPGGSATASEIIWELIRETGRTRPVVASMGSTAGSGGYYVAAAASDIFAAPATLTGSIGVVVGKPVLKGLLEKIHLHAYTYARGKNATLDDPFSELTPGQRQTVVDQMEKTFQLFKSRVAEGRRGKIKNLDAVATGRVYTGRQALDLGLVDQLGTLADAVAAAAKKAKITSYEVVHYPAPKTLPELLLEGLGYQMDSDDVSIADLRMLAARIDPWATLAGTRFDSGFLRRTLRLVKLMRSGRVLAIWPYQISIK